MFAVIQTGGKQLRVEVGQSYFVEKLDGNEGDKVEFDKVLLVSDKDVKLGNPYLKNAKVVASIDIGNVLVREIQCCYPVPFAHP